MSLATYSMRKVSLRLVIPICKLFVHHWQGVINVLRIYCSLNTYHTVMSFTLVTNSKLCHGYGLSISCVDNYAHLGLSQSILFHVGYLPSIFM